MDDPEWILSELKDVGGELSINSNNKIIFDVKGSFELDLHKMIRTLRLARVKK